MPNESLNVRSIFRPRLEHHVRRGAEWRTSTKRAPRHRRFGNRSKRLLNGTRRVPAAFSNRQPSA